jgi:putative component of membrane protein insertase Oxa1/YidC/SpoIIIJ protein YidD
MGKSLEMKRICRCVSSYSGGRDQEDHSSKPVPETLSQKKPFTKKGLVEWLKV